MLGSNWFIEYREGSCSNVQANREVPILGHSKGRMRKEREQKRNPFRGKPFGKHPHWM
jgi:hypothetical protein